MSVLAQLKKYDNSPLFNEDQIGRFKSLKLAETLYDNSQFINNIVSLSSVYSFDEMMTILEEQEDIEKFMLKSVIFDNARKILENNYIKTLKAPRVITGFYKCVNCGSDNVQTRPVQTRSGDESTTDVNKCQECQTIWRVG